MWGGAKNECGPKAGQKFNDLTLSKVITVHRHGERAPAMGIPLAAGQAKNWPEGFVELSAKGKRSQYKLGQMFRQKYSSFLTDSPREVVAMSSTVRRAFDSCALFLAGLCPPKGVWVWNESLPWQPIPIKSLEDTPLFKQIMQKVLDTAKEAMQQIKNDPDILREFYKDPMGYFRKVLEMHSTYTPFMMVVVDEIMCALGEECSPQWVLDHLEEIKKLSNRLFGEFTLEWSSLIAKEFYVDFKNILQKYNGLSEKRFFPVFLHDTNLFDIVRTIDENFNERPDFNATIVFEIYLDSEGNDYVKVQYLPCIDGEFRNLAIKGSVEPCPIETFFSCVSKSA